jgi:hypothetical protein
MLFYGWLNGVPKLPEMARIDPPTPGTVPGRVEAALPKIGSQGLDTATFSIVPSREARTCLVAQSEQAAK